MNAITDRGLDAATVRDAVKPAARNRAGWSLRRLLLGGAGFAIAAGVGWAAYEYATTWRYFVTTDDAYVNADSTAVAPKVSGYVGQLLVDDNQEVRTGQVLARIDDRDFRAALAGAIAGVDAAHASIGNLDAQIAAQRSMIREADASVTAENASLGLSRRDDVRRRKMAQVGYGSEEQADTASTAVAESTASLQRLEAAALNARAQIGVLTTRRRLAEAQLARAEAELTQARLNLGYATIAAPIDGTVAARTVRLGQYVQVGTELMTLVPLRKVYVTANFKETQLTDVVPGQEARITADTFPSDPVEGRVDTLAPASGLEFSLLPPDNATGNFTKIVQRIPVKIVFPATGPLVGRLRPGMSVTVSIDTRTGGAPIAPSRR